MENQWESSYETREMIKRLIREEDADPVRYEVGHGRTEYDGAGDGAGDYAYHEGETSATNGDDDIMVHESDKPGDAGASASADISTQNSSAAASADSVASATTAGASAMMQALNSLASTNGKHLSKVSITTTYSGAPRLYPSL